MVVVGRGLVGLQYFDAALPYFGRAGCMGPTPEQSKRIADDRVRAGALRRAFDRPGIKAQLKDYRCPTVPLIRTQLEAELKWAREELRTREEEIYALGPQLYQQLQRDAGMREDVASAAEKCRVKDPYQAVLEAEARVADYKTQLEEIGSGEGERPKASGFFGKIKAAAASAANQVGEVKLKKQIASGEQAVVKAKRDMARVLACDMDDYTFKSPVLVGIARRGQVLEAFSDALQSIQASLLDRIQRVDQIGKR